MQNPRTVLRVFGYQSIQDLNEDDVITLSNSGPILKKSSSARLIIGSLLTLIAISVCSVALDLMQVLLSILLAHLAVLLNLAKPS
jgi:hypothetical protein